MKRGVLIVAALVVGAPAGMAPAEFGDLVWGRIDIGSQTGETGALGVQFFGGEYFVSSRALVAPPHKVFVFDYEGVMTGNFDQHPDAHSSAWGYRDGMTDGTYLYFGCETGLYRHDPDGSNAVEIINGGGPNANWRALAYDPTGDGGNGSFWSISFSSNLVEASMTGTVLSNLPNADGWSVYGLEYDPVTGNLWAHNRNDPDPPEVVEIDIQDGSPTQGRLTGVQFDTGVSGEVQGGLTGVPDGAGGSGNLFDVVALMQVTPDAIVGYEIYSGTSPERYVHGADYDAFSPVTDPTVSPWLELKPMFGDLWDCSAWTDNGNGVLDACDVMELTDGASTSSWHVEECTVTAVLELVEGGPPEDWLYFDYIGPYTTPIGMWRQIYPNFNINYECVDWLDAGVAGVLDQGDYLICETPIGQIFLHVVDTGVDLFLLEESGPDPCPEDVNGDNVVNVLDLLAVLAAWGGSGGPEDINGDGIVNVLDLLAVLGAWGPCP